MTGDVFDVAPADATAEVVPVEFQVLLLERTRAPEKRRAEAPVSDRTRPLPFDGNEQHAGELGAHGRTLPLHVTGAVERDRAHERRLDGLPRRIDGQGLELDPELGKIRPGA